MIEAIRHRTLLGDPHPLQYLWSTYLEPWLFGQVRSDKGWIPSHYDIEPEFFLHWLDRKIRGYSHAFFESESEPLETAMERKFQFAWDACGLKPGDRVLDIGGGWGSFVEFAGKRGARVTSVTISDVSQRFMQDLIGRLELPCTVVREHLLEFKSAERFDAIVNLGVTEHLPDYRRTIAQYARLLKPGRRIYLDAYSGERYAMPSFILKYVYEGNTSPLHLATYFAELDRAPFEVILLENDRRNYFLTCQAWARNLERAREAIVARWGEFLYRRFRTYLWSAANSFRVGTLSAHHMVLELAR
jgi:cyclopropane-fatty-acyl-phospholipid synthase